MKSPHRAAALRGLLYCAAILIKKFLVDNAEIRSGAEKSMVLPDCRVEFFSSVRRRRALFQRRPLSPTRFAMRYPRRLSRRFRWSAPGQECFHTSFYESALEFQLAAPVALVHFCAEQPSAYPQCQVRFPVWFRHSRGLSEQLRPSP